MTRALGNYVPRTSVGARILNARPSSDSCQSGRRRNKETSAYWPICRGFINRIAASLAGAGKGETRAATAQNDYLADEWTDVWTTKKWSQAGWPQPQSSGLQRPGI